ncbi:MULTISPECIES: DegT/DnrJ/EryC1/StrS family aminotransferase [unclassified Arsukibacterium]|uniref:DegT/DnrJ/EryC1/StrS family aminotransferase n=1 Tax=unclassified Arsukibacterium TaxID=2635278 RepID=UPI000C96D8D2|nr:MULTISPECIES: DegT/DnrJ/EryC1/StrS family aminotransferase [unclassified Arsukibacterium]MAA96129.1 UDP-4-amino-4,6-dideoxy-N-acetyl-beta-L-altrosamine transaminase [Rheinheimera sp.]HAW94450.1 UDP-4-amino-4,6-dideoxy-N-acetyl-beta-L-altrosamine transaminase [Candidatus Azambacteria bacterium]|tara:strand:+ start:489 stop:1655 length:1167 start_codon:yes stop_codon:yes gene_type:complete
MSANKFLPFALPEIGEEEINEVAHSLRSGWITTGPKAKQFEADFSIFLGDSELESIAVNSATSGLHLALEAVGVGPGDEVIVPTYTFTATAEIVRYLGATPVMVDVDAHTFNMTVDTFAAAITDKTKAVMPVHFAGLACDMDPIIALAKKHDIKVVEDAAHALPTRYKGKMIGALESDITVFSFYANKTMTTGEGGMVVTRNAELAKRCKVMRLHGISRDAFDRYVSTKPAWFYEVVAPGFKYNMPDIAAAIGIHQLKRLPDFQIKREQMAAVYHEALADLPVELPATAPGDDIHAWHLYPLKIKPEAGVERGKFIEQMAELGIGCSVHFIPLHLHPYWRDTYKLTPEMFPVAQRIFEQEVSLPLYTKMTADDQARVIAAVRQVLRHA